MSAIADEDRATRFGSASFAPLLPALRRLPRPLVEWGMAAAAVAGGLLLNGRYRRARHWAAARGLSGIARERLAVALLANHGRYVAEEALAAGAPDGIAARGVVVQGAEHLASAAGRGALLLGFHLGPPNAWLALRALGYPIHMAVRGRAAVDPEAWARARHAGIAVTLPEGGASRRAAALYTLRRLLADGALVAITADGPFGDECFRIEFRGGPVVIRRGWLSLRRATGLPAFPLLTHTEGSRRVIVVHPPLPAPVADEALDIAACRNALTPLVTQYVDRVPSQCRWLATDAWLDPS